MSAVQVPAGRYKFTLIAACLAVMIAQATFSLPGPLNGVWQTAFHAQGSQLTWAVSAFAVPMVIFELTSGAIGDLFGRRRLLMGGIGLMMVGALISFLTHSVQLMWVGQALCGLGAAIMFPTSLAMIASTAPTHAARTRAIAAWAGFLSLGAALAPLLAGELEKHASWRDVYLVIIGVSLIAIAVAVRAQDSSAPEGRKLDIPGQLTLALGLFAVLYGLIQGSVDGYTKGSILAAFIVGAILLAAFIVIELRTESPLLYLSLFRNRAFAITGLTAVIGMFAFVGCGYTVAFFLGAVQHFSALKIGIVDLFLAGPAFLMAPLVAFLIRRVSPRWTLSAGYLCIAGAGIWMSTFNMSVLSWARFMVPIGLVGVGFGLVVASLTAVAVGSVPVRLAGMASATTNMLRDLGFALGIVIIGAVTVSSANHKLLRGLGAALHGVRQPYASIAAGISHQAGAVAINGLPVIPGPGAHSAPLVMPAALHELAYTSLGSAYALGFRVAGIAAAVASALILLGLVGVKAASADESLASPVDVIGGLAIPTDGHAAVV